MADRRENSVLFSLRELREIENERVKNEEETERSRLEAEAQAKRDEEQRRLMEEEARVRREREDRERAVREDALRLQETEKRAQIEAATRLEQTRIEAEAQARAAAKKFPTGAVVSGVIALVLISGGIVGYLIYNHNQELIRERTALEAKAEAEKQRIAAESKAELERQKKQLDELRAQLEKATDDKERNRIRAEIAAKSSGSHPSSSGKPKSDSGKSKSIDIDTKTNDPTGGLGF